MADIIVLSDSDTDAEPETGTVDSTKTIPETDNPQPTGPGVDHFTQLKLKQKKLLQILPAKSNDTENRTILLFPETKDLTPTTSKTKAKPKRKSKKAESEVSNEATKQDDTRTVPKPAKQRRRPRIKKGAVDEPSVSTLEAGVNEAVCKSPIASNQRAEVSTPIEKNLHSSSLITPLRLTLDSPISYSPCLDSPSPTGQLTNSFPSASPQATEHPLRETSNFNQAKELVKPGLGAGKQIWKPPARAGDELVNPTVKPVTFSGLRLGLSRKRKLPPLHKTNGSVLS